MLLGNNKQQYCYTDIQFAPDYFPSGLAMSQAKIKISCNNIDDVICTPYVVKTKVTDNVYILSGTSEMDDKGWICSNGTCSIRINDSVLSLMQVYDTPSILKIYSTAKNLKCINLSGQTRCTDLYADGITDISTYQLNITPDLSGVYLKNLSCVQQHGQSFFTNNDSAKWYDIANFHRSLFFPSCKYINASNFAYGMACNVREIYIPQLKSTQIGLVNSGWSYPYSLNPITYPRYETAFLQLLSCNRLAQGLNGKNGYVYNPHLLSSIYMPECVCISSYSFTNNTNLRTITAPKIKYVGSKAFESCTSLTDTIFTDVETIDEYAFDGCTKYCGDADYFENLKLVKDYAFRNCSNMDGFVSYGKCVSINNNAFNGCKNLEQITIPKLYGIQQYWLSGASSTTLDLLVEMSQMSTLFSVAGYPFGSKARNTIFNINDDSGQLYIYQLSTAQMLSADIGYYYDSLPIGDQPYGFVMKTVNNSWSSAKLRIGGIKSADQVSAVIFRQPFDGNDDPQNSTTKLITSSNSVSSNYTLKSDYGFDVFAGYGFKAIAANGSGLANTTYPTTMSSLERVTLGGSIEFAYTSAFANTYSLEAFEIYPSIISSNGSRQIRYTTISTIPKYAFANSAIKYAYLPSHSWFAACLNKNLSAIGTYAFLNCYNLNSLYIDYNALKSIHHTALSNCWNISDFDYDSSKLNLSAISQFPFGLNNTYCNTYFIDIRTGYKITPDKCHKYIVRLKNPVQIISQGHPNVAFTLRCGIYALDSYNSNGGVIFWGDGKSTYVSRIFESDFITHTYSKIPTSVSATINTDVKTIAYKPAVYDSESGDDGWYQIGISADISFDSGISDVGFWYQKSGETTWTKAEYDIIQDTLMHECKS